MRREVRADKRTVLLITETTNECDTRSKSCCSHQRRCDVSSGLLLARPDAALIVGLEGIYIQEIIDRNAADPSYIDAGSPQVPPLVGLQQGLVLLLHCHG